MNERLIIYQLFPRIFTNMNAACVPYGTYEQNGSGKFNDITEKTVKSIKNLGVNTLWLTGVIEMATKTEFEGIPADNRNVVKGEAGSPYAIKDYYDVAPSLAEDTANRMNEFEALVKRIHQCELKVLIDFVPNHTARNYHSDQVAGEGRDFGANDDITKFFYPRNNYYYIPNQKFSPSFPLDAEEGEAYNEFPAKATGNDCFTAFCGRNDWYETVKLNYGYDPGNGMRAFDPVPDTWNKMLDILLFWCGKGVDGFRCDMVFMVPQEFWHWVIPRVKIAYPDVIFIGEIYDLNLYRPFLDYCHFDFLYDKVNLYDTLVGIEKYNLSAAQLTSCWQRVDGIGNKMLNFLENHDEVRYASKEYAEDPRKVVPSLVVSATMSSGPFMIYYGQELGENGSDNEGFAGNNNRSTIFDYWSFDTMRRWYDNGKCSVKKLTAQEKWLRKLYSNVLTMCNSVDAFRCGQFFDLMYFNLQNPEFNPHSIFAYIRYCANDAYLVVANFSPNSETCSVKIPELAFDMVNIEEGTRRAIDLLWGNEYDFNCSRENGVKLNIGPHDAIILPLGVKSVDSKK